MAYLRVGLTIIFYTALRVCGITDSGNWANEAALNVVATSVAAIKMIFFMRTLLRVKLKN
jgi:hypothetical protein